MRTNFKMWRESASLIIAAKSTYNTSINCNYKVLCLKRSSKSGVMPNHYVFPGGNISKSDSNENWLKLFQNSGYDSNSFEELYPKENIPPIIRQETNHETLPKFLSLRICAIRETFEECGVLLCRRKEDKDKKGTWASYIGGSEILQWQNKVHENPNEFFNLCNQFQVYPDVWGLKIWSNWVTPPCIPSKFDTIFFISTLAQMPDTHREPQEIQHLMWASPEEYISYNRKQKIIFPIPQFYEMSKLRNFTDATCLSEFADTRSKHGCEMYFPHRILTKTGLYSILPGDGLYPKEIDKGITEVPIVEALPECSVKNRLYHEADNSNQLIVENFQSKDKHLPPQSE